MLMLTRGRAGYGIDEDKVTIFTSDGKIEITVTGHTKFHCKLGFVAPKNVRILRNEIIEAHETKPESVSS